VQKADRSPAVSTDIQQYSSRLSTAHEIQRVVDLVERKFVRHDAIVADPAGFGEAHQSRDIARVRRIYVGLSAAQEGSWRTFFDRVRNLKVSLSVVGSSGAAASANAFDVYVEGVYTFDNVSTGRPERRLVTFQATLARDATGWHITAIH